MSTYGLACIWTTLLATVAYAAVILYHEFHEGLIATKKWRLRDKLYFAVGPRARN
jgi:hypothetical protein